MYFNENEIRQDTAMDSRQEYVNLSTVTDRIANALQKELAFEHDYLDGELMTIEDAEEILSALRRTSINILNARRTINDIVK